MRFSDLYSWRGSLNRGPYAAWGALLVALKYNLDRLTAAHFDRSWFFPDYLISSRTLEQLARSPEDQRFYRWLVLTSLPFIWAGVVMTIRRLRSVGAPVALSALFFLPGINLVLFLLLVLIPESDQERSDRPDTGVLARLIPLHPLGSAALAVGLSLILGVGSALLAVNYLQDYGWGLFVGVPFCMGLLSSLMAGYHYRRSVGACLLVATLSVGLLALAILALAVEGAICIAMAAPIGLVLAWMGSLLGYFLQLSYWQRNAGAVLGALALLTPGLVSADALHPTAAPLWSVTTTCTIDAPPAVVWRHVVRFSELPPPTELLFATGIAYPVRATISGQGTGAVRRCEFSTGAFVEPITVWDEPRQLSFSVTEQPFPMHELSPYNDLHPPHLDHFLVSKRGEFRLIDLGGGQTRLEGTTWYAHDIWPAYYWRFWSDYVIHTIHRRVLDHIRAEAQAEVASKNAAD